MSRLPIPGSDDNIWGDVLNDFLGVSLAPGGTLDSNVVGTAQLQNNCVTNAQLDTSTQSIIASVASKYVKPAGGIPSSDLSSAVQTNLTAANTAVQSVNSKTPSSGNVVIKVADLNDASAAAGATNNQVLSYNSGTSQWVPATVSSTTVSDATTSSKGIVELAGDLSGTATSPTVVKLNGGITLPGSAPSASGQVLTTTSTGGSAATAWQTPAAGVTLDATASDIQPDTTTGTAVAGATGKAADAGHQHTLVTHDHSTTNKGGQLNPTTALTATGTPSGSTFLRGDNTWSTPAAGVTLDSTASDIQPLGTQAAGSTGKAADASHVHAMPTLDQVNPPAANVSLNSHKITSLANGSAATDAAAFGQIPTNLPPNGSAGGDLTGSYPNPTLSNTANVESIISANTTVAGAEQTAHKDAANGYAGLDSSGLLKTAELPGSVLSGSSFKSIKSFNGTTDGTAINAALTALAGPGIVFLPAGTAGIDTSILLDAGQWLVGFGWGTVLQAVNSFNSTMISLVSANSTGIGVKDLTLDGNKANQTSGIAIGCNWTGNTISSISPWFTAITLENLYIRFTKGDAVALTNSTNGMSPILNNVQTVRCDGNGFNIQMSDGQFSNCGAEKSGLAGWTLGPNAASGHLTNCFGNDSGQVTPASGHGFKITSGFMTLSGCQSQDNSLHGYYLSGSASDAQLVGCHADSNSFANGSANGAGFYIDTGISRVSISGCYSQDRFAGGSRTQAYGYYINGTADFVRIDSSYYNNVIAGITNVSSGTNNVTGTTSADVDRLPTRATRPTGVLAQTMPRTDATSDLSGVLLSGSLRILGLVTLQAFTKYSNITCSSGSTQAAVSPLNQWFALYDTGGNLICTTADNTNTAWAINTALTLAIAKDSGGGTITSYTPAVDTQVWVVLMVVASTTPSLAGASIMSGISSMLPVIGANAGTGGLTTPSTAPATFTVGGGFPVPSTKAVYAHLT